MPKTRDSFGLSENARIARPYCERARKIWIAEKMTEGKYRRRDVNVVEIEAEDTGSSSDGSVCIVQVIRAEDKAEN